MISGVIPQSGRTSYASLSRIGEITGKDLSDVIRILERSKKLSTKDFKEAQQYLKELQGQGYHQFTLGVDRKSEDRPIRAVFLGLDTQISGIDVRIEGTEPHNVSSLIRLAGADFAFVGFDELLATMQRYLDTNGRFVTRWGNFNYELRVPTDVRVAGSANLKYFDEETQKSYQDFVGFFIIGNKETSQERDLGRLLKQGQKVYVKGRYEGIVQNLFPYVKTVPVKDVEDAVKADKYGLGIEIVRSGGTVKMKGLVVYGAPLFLSESLIVADYGKYQRNPDLQRVVQALQPQGFFDEDRISQFADWYIFLENNLGENWRDKPDIKTLFLGSNRSSLRPYTLESRDWGPSDDSPPEKKLQEAFLIDSRLKELQIIYDFKKRLIGTNGSVEAVAHAIVETLQS